jgi:uncharacterized membrane protein YphA (DoxX/SURF4 family)
MTRAVRGSVGFLAGLGAAIKTKVAATIGGKLVVAALIALGLAWPMAVLWLVGFFVFAAVVAAIFGGDVTDGSGSISIARTAPTVRAKTSAAKGCSS